MSQNSRAAVAAEIMRDFARQTGLEPESDHPRRYLWTDAFAVCNYLDLFLLTKDDAYHSLALRLVNQVHHTLGRHRDDDQRRGWISGLGDQEGELHPTKGGLRIGKKLSERKQDEPQDERLEWDQDGQYYHYLTKWMHALSCVSQVTRDPKYLGWAIELAKSAHKRFTYPTSPGGRKMMYWKMSTDLTYPLVRSMGQHDPLDGFVTYSELKEAASRDFKESALQGLSQEIEEMAQICRSMDLPTSDPLGIGGLLSDASRIAQLMIYGGPDLRGLLERVLSSAEIGVEAVAMGRTLDYPAEYRLAFRELGLSIGLSAVGDLARWIAERPDLFEKDGQLGRVVEDLRDYVVLKEKIERFWLDERNRKASTWVEHREINMVMLATSLEPGVFLRVRDNGNYL